MVMKVYQKESRSRGRWGKKNFQSPGVARSLKDNQCNVAKFSIPAKFAHSKFNSWPSFELTSGASHQTGQFLKLGRVRFVTVVVAVVVVVIKY